MILLIDGNNLAFVATSLTPLSRSDGFPTQGIMNFFKSLRSYITNFEAKKVFIAWDGGKSKKRMALLPTYKESRKIENKTPEQKMNLEEMLVQLPIIKQTAADLGLYQIEGGGIEGDDLIALMAMKSHQMDKEAIICSSDSDFHQLVNPKISVFSIMNKKAGRHITYDNFAKVYDGLLPLQFLDYKALQGDSGDDIPGVKGIGPKNAHDLLIKFNTAENFRKMVETGEHNPTKTQQKIIDNWKSFEISKAMISLQHPLADFSTAKIERQEPNWAAVREMAIEYQIGSIVAGFGTWIKPFKELS